MGWFKVWDREWLTGTEGVSIEGQGAFIRVLCLANTILDNGRLSYEKKAPLSLEQIFAGAGINQDLWDELVLMELITSKDGYWIVKNWTKYQSEYQRQKGYRQRLQPKVTVKGTPEEVKKLRSKEVILNTKELNLPPKADEILTPHRKLCLFWTETMISETGNKGPFTGRDGKNLVELLKVADPKNVERVILWAIKMGRKDKYISQKCDRLYKIYENWNILFSKVSGEKVVSLAGSKYKSETVG